MLLFHRLYLIRELQVIQYLAFNQFIGDFIEPIGVNSKYWITAMLIGLFFEI